MVEGVNETNLLKETDRGGFIDEGGAAVIRISGVQFLVINPSGQGDKFVIFSPTGFRSPPPNDFLQKFFPKKEGKRIPPLVLKETAAIIGPDHIYPDQLEAQRDNNIPDIYFYKDRVSRQITISSDGPIGINLAPTVDSQNLPLLVRGQVVRIPDLGSLNKSVTLILPAGIRVELRREKGLCWRILVDDRGGNRNCEIGRIKIKNGVGFFTIKREHLLNVNPELAKFVSGNHCSVILLQDGPRIECYIYDHSTNGTEVTLDNITEEPQVIISRVYHKEQQIEGDPHSVGGDYWLSGKDVLLNFGKNVNPDNLLIRGGNAVVVMDTATLQTRGETPRTTTAIFAWEFLKAYYWYIANMFPPLEAASSALQWVYNNEYLGRLGPRTEATFTFVTVFQDEEGRKKALILYVGNNSVELISSSGKKQVLTEKMRGKLYYDRSIGANVEETVLVASGIDNFKILEFEIPSDGESIYVYTDGVLSLNPKNPPKSLLNPNDDALLVRIPLK